MWIFCQDGFYSVARTANCVEDELAVRARSLEDMKRFRDRCLGRGVAVSDISEFTHADYPYRVRLKASDLGQIAAGIIGEISYSRFRDASLSGGLDEERRAALFQVWSAAYRYWR